jgi:hypothetical protein
MRFPLQLLEITFHVFMAADFMHLVHEEDIVQCSSDVQYPFCSDYLFMCFLKDNLWNLSILCLPQVDIITRLPGR